MIHILVAGEVRSESVHDFPRLMIEKSGNVVIGMECIEVQMPESDDKQWIVKCLDPFKSFRERETPLSRLKTFKGEINLSNKALI